MSEIQDIRDILAIIDNGHRSIATNALRESSITNKVSFLEYDLYDAIYEAYWGIVFEGQAP